MKKAPFSLKHWTIGRRLAVGFSVVVLLTCILATTAYLGLNRVHRNLNELTQNALPGLVTSDRVLLGAYEYRVITLKHFISEDPAEMQALDAQCDALAQRIETLLREYAAKAVADEDRRLLETVEPAFQAYRSVAREVRALSRENRKQEAAAATAKAAPLYDAFEQAALALARYNENAGRLVSADADQAVLLVERIIVSVSAGVLAVAVCAGMFLTRSVRTIIQGIANSINDASSQIAAAANQVSASSQALAEGSSEQAASLEETSASLEEMSSMAKRNGDNAQQAKGLARETRAAADTGATHMTEMRHAMDEIKTSSDEIGKIVKTIDEIAFQTNILALNAAVEAARAGEAGAGFAVVADEVRSLAQRSARSARETAEKIEVAIQKSHRGVVISGQVASALADILERARRMDAFVAEIAQASLEQSQGIQQLNTAVSQMDRVTQSNASGAEETAAAAEELNSQAAHLRDSVAAMMRLVDGSGKPSVRDEDTPAPQKPASPARVLSAPERRRASEAAAEEESMADAGAK